MSRVIDTLHCPALNRSIDLGYCLELQMATNSEIIWDGMEDRFDARQEETCRKCNKRVDPAMD